MLSTLTHRLFSRISRPSFSSSFPGTFPLPVCSRPLFPNTTSLLTRRAFASKQEVDNTSTDHAQFIAEASSASAWTSKAQTKPEDADSNEEVERLSPGKGKLSPTSSHLFKLILPLSGDKPPTIFLLHPNQPLSHVGKLIEASLPKQSENTEISFRSVSSTQRHFEWSASTDIGDFIRDAARASSFSIHVTSPRAGLDDFSLEVEVPSFADRTRFMRRRLAVIQNKLHKMEELKSQCDRDAHSGAKRVAVGGFAMLVVYWAGVARLTFWDYGWDLMEPITYLSGLSTVICGYLWFLYQGREVSYSSVLNHSISARREALYKERGLDIDKWADLVAEARALRKEVSQIARDYDEKGKLADADPGSDKIEEREQVKKEELS